MKRITISFIIALLIYSCGCKDETGYTYFDEFEASVIPPDIISTVEFINQNAEIISAEYTEYDENPLISTPLNQRCLTEFNDKNTVLLSFEELELTFDFQINVFDIGNGPRTIFTIFTNDYFYYLDGNLDGTENIEQFLTDYSSDGFEYNNVFVFTPYMELEIIDIIYKPQVGIKFIKFNNGNYLKLLE